MGVGAGAGAGGSAAAQGSGCWVQGHLRWELTWYCAGSWKSDSVFRMV